eukprot:3529446-Pleurochrysis_carterae.AAC.1
MPECVRPRLALTEVESMRKVGRQVADADVCKTSMPREYSLSNICSRSSEKPRSATLPSASH